MSSERTFYDILQVSEEAETEVIEAAYRRLARKYHPDVNPSPDAGERVRKLNAAYEILRDPAARRRYDEKLLGQKARSSEGAKESRAEQERASGTAGGESFSGEKGSSAHSKKGPRSLRWLARSQTRVMLAGVVGVLIVSIALWGPFPVRKHSAAQPEAATRSTGASQGKTQSSQKSNSPPKAVVTPTVTAAPNAKTAREYYDRGVDYRNRDLYDLAIADLNRAIELEPNSASAYNARGYTHYLKRDYDSAIVDFNRAIQISSNYTQAWERRGLAHFQKGEYERAIWSSTVAIALEPMRANGYKQRARFYSKTGDDERAVADLTKVIELEPDKSVNYNNRGWVYYLQGDYLSAIADATKAIELDHQNNYAYDTRGNAYRGKTDYDRAIADLNQAIQIDPKRAYPYTSRGYLYYDKGEYERAIKDFNTSIELDQELAEAYLRRGQAYYVMGQLKQARLDYDKSIALAEAQHDRRVLGEAEDALLGAGYQISTIRTPTPVAAKLRPGATAIAVQPPTGMIKRSSDTSALGKLLVKNGSDSDALVILTDQARQTVMSGYVRPGEPLEMKGISVGTYWLYFSKGKEWDNAAKKFTRDVSYQRFDDEFAYKTTQTRSGDYVDTSYTTFTVTLYGVLGGNAKTPSVYSQEFPNAE